MTARSNQQRSWRKFTCKVAASVRRPTPLSIAAIGERSSHTWFVLTYLLGLNNVRNYDGSWTEWGNRVAAPIEKGA